MAVAAPMPLLAPVTNTTLFMPKYRIFRRHVTPLILTDFLSCTLPCLTPILLETISQCEARAAAVHVRPQAERVKLTLITSLVYTAHDPQRNAGPNTGRSY